MAIPILTTVAISAITPTTATSGGSTITSVLAVTVKGCCWNTIGSPTTADSHTSDGTGTAAFVSSLTSLVETTTYYVRAYAVNSDGTGYGNELSFTATSNPIINSVAVSYDKIPTAATILPAILSTAISYDKIPNPVAMLPKINSVAMSYDRPTYQLSNFPQIRSISIGWDRPGYDKVNVGLNPIFAFSGV